MIGVGVIGYGYWGPNLVRNFSEAVDSKVVAIADGRADRLELAGRRSPGASLVKDVSEVICNPSVDAVAIATPVSTHYELALASLQAGKHVLVEKPLAQSSGQALRLIEEADKRGLVLLVDHTFVYSGAVRKMRDLVAEGELGELRYFDSSRVNLGLFQHDVNVLWDLAVHDLSIMDVITGQQPVAVSAAGKAHVGGQPENIAFMTLSFDSPLIAHVNVNWLSPVKIRRTILGGSEKMLVYDDLDVSEPIKLYNKGLIVNGQADDTVYQMLFSYRWGDMWAPRVDDNEPLAVEARHFLACINGDEKPLTDGQMGLRVVRVLEAASESLAQGGVPVEVRRDE